MASSGARQMDIVGLGLSTLDVLLQIGDMPTWETPGHLSRFGVDGGGPVGTACVAASRLGARVGYVGTAGNDEVAELKVRFLTGNGVDISRLVERYHPETQVIIVYVDEATGERVFSSVRGLRDSALRPSELDREYITSARYLHLDGFHSEAALQAAKWMREAGKQVSVDYARTDADSVSPETRELVEHADVLICGSGFGRALTGHENVWEAGDAVLAMGPTTFVQTEGERGSYTVTPEDRFHTPPFPVDVVDTTGAGDVFHGGYLVGLLKGWDPRTVASFATGVSAVKCTRFGGRKGIPDFNEVADFLRERGVALP